MHFFYDDFIDEIKPNTLYVISPENNLLHAELIRDIKLKINTRSTKKTKNIYLNILYIVLACIRIQK